MAAVCERVSEHAAPVSETSKTPRIAVPWYGFGEQGRAEGGGCEAVRVAVTRPVLAPWHGTAARRRHTFASFRATWDQSGDDWLGAFCRVRRASRRMSGLQKRGHLIAKRRDAIVDDVPDEVVVHTELRYRDPESMNGLRSVALRFLLFKWSVLALRRTPLCSAVFTRECLFCVSGAEAG